MTAPWRWIAGNGAFDAYAIDPGRATLIVEPARALPAARADLLREAAARLAPHVELGDVGEEAGELRARGMLGVAHVTVGVASRGTSAVAYVLVQAAGADHAADAARVVAERLATSASPFDGWID